MSHFSAFKLPLLVCLLTLATAAYALKTYAPADPNAVSGSGFVAAEPREVHGVTRVALHTLGDVTIDVGGELSVLVSAEDNIVPLLATYERDGWLIIEGPDNLTLYPSRPILYMITMPVLTQVHVYGAGSVYARGLNAHAVDVTIDGTGSVSLSGEVETQNVTVADRGSYVSPHLTCHDAAVTIAGQGSAELNVSRRLSATITGSGNVNYTGHPQVVQHITGEGALIRH